jgi:nickel transport system ATP-binding protein
MSVLSLRGVTKSYRQGGFFGGGRRREVLSGVDLDLSRGECLGLVGRSGCGKSTLGRVALGLERPDAGTVRYKGRDVADLAGQAWKDFRRNVQVVFQNYAGAVNPRMRAMDIVAEPLRNFGRESGSDLERRVGDLLEAVWLRPSDAAKRPHQFSGGQLQRVCIARAMALDPEVLVLDEAVSSLDMLSQARVTDLLEVLTRERGVSCLFISHDLRVVSRLCSRVAVMRHGRVEESAARNAGRFALAGRGYAELAGAVLPARPA